MTIERDRRERRQQEVERVRVALPQVLPPRHALLVRDLVRADVAPDDLGAFLRQPGHLGAERMQDRRGIRLRRLEEAIGDRARQVATGVAETGVALERVPDRQALEMPRHAVRLDETHVEVLQDVDGHGASPIFRTTLQDVRLL
jgi:hypothetical protein